MKKKWRNVVYPIVIIIVFAIVSIMAVSCNQVFANHQISLDDLDGLVFVNKDITYYLRFYKFYLVEQDQGKEEIFEYNIDGKFLHFTNVVSGREINDYYIFSKDQIFNYKTREYLYRYEQA